MTVVNGPSKQPSAGLGAVQAELRLLPKLKRLALWNEAYGTCLDLVNSPVPAADAADPAVCV